MEKQEPKFCSICGIEYIGYGNNAQPVNDGRCCDVCNANVVVPHRIRAINRSPSRNGKGAV